MLVKIFEVIYVHDPEYSIQYNAFADHIQIRPINKL